jgi:hypothetical protein
MKTHRIGINTPLRPPPARPQRLETLALSFTAISLLLAHPRQLRSLLLLERLATCHPRGSSIIFSRRGSRSRRSTASVPLVALSISRACSSGSALGTPAADAAPERAEHRAEEPLRAAALLLAAVDGAAFAHRLLAFRLGRSLRWR